jgi:hypothetical protein
MFGAGTLLLAPGPVADAQDPGPSAEPQRSQRVLLVGSAVFEGQWKPLTTAGVLYQLSLTRFRVGRDELGVTTISPPRWYLHTLVSGGVAFDAQGSGKELAITAQGQLGVVRREDSPITAWGPVVHASSTPRAFGFAMRAELMDNIGLSVGVVTIRGVDGHRLMVSIDYFRKICEDLGFGWLC